MAELFAFFPELTLVLISALLLGAASLVQLVWARRLDAAAPNAARVMAEPGPYREAPPDERSQPLALGRLPLADQLWTVAWLRAGKQGVVQALLAHASAADWLGCLGTSVHVAETLLAPSDRVAASFCNELRPVAGLRLSATELYGLAASAAAAHEVELRSHAQAAGLVRSDADQHKLSLIPVAAGVAAELLILIRLLTASGELAQRGFVVVLFMSVVVGTLLITIRSPRSRNAKRYLEWLRPAAEPVIADVIEGRRQQPSDVTLAVAVVGISAVATSPVIGDLAAAYEFAVTPQQLVAM